MTNRNRRVRRVKCRNNKNKFVFTKDLKLIEPYADYDICIENYFSRFGPNDIILYNKNIGFALIQHKDFCPKDILNDAYCLDYIYIIENYRGRVHGKRLMNLVLKHFQIIINTLNDSLGFFEHIRKDLGLERINTGMPFGTSFISTNLDINREPVVKNCLGGCGLIYSDYKRYVCGDCYLEFARYNIDMRLIKLNDALRTKLNKQQPAIIAQMTNKHILEMAYNSNDIEYRKTILSTLLEKMNKLSIT